MIRKLPGQNLWRLYSDKKIYNKTKGWIHRNLGTFSSIEAAKKHERNIQFFKLKKR